MPIDVMLNQIIVLFLLMALGYTLAKLKIIDGPFSQKLTWLLCYIVMPCLILKAFQIPFSVAKLHNFLIMALATLVIHIVYIILATVCFNKWTLRGKAHLSVPVQYMSIYSNCGFMGLPLVAAFMHDIGVFYGSVYIAINGLFIWTHGLLIYSGKMDRQSLLKVFINPNVIILASGVILFLTSTHLPKPVLLTLGHIGGMNTALSMIVVGAAMTNIRFRQIFTSAMAWITSLFRNLIFPLLILVILYFWGIRGDLLTTAMILSACPVAGLSVLFAQLNHKDTVFPCITLTLSTLMSIFSIPIILTLTHLVNH